MSNIIVTKSAHIDIDTDISPFQIVPSATSVGVSLAFSAYRQASTVLRKNSSFLALPQNIRKIMAHLRVPQNNEILVRHLWIDEAAVERGVPGRCAGWAEEKGFLTAWEDQLAQ